MAAVAELTSPFIVDTIPAFPPSPQLRIIPPNLTRNALRARMKRKETVPQTEWAKRSRAVEEYVQDVIATQTDIVERVEISSNWSGEGPDISVYFVKGFAIEKACIEVKSSTLEIREGKRKIRDRMLDNMSRAWDPKTATKGREIDPKLAAQWRDIPDTEKERIISGWLTDKGIILINGGEKDGHEKTPEEILRDSFYPQLTRMVEKAVGMPLNVPKDQLLMFPGQTLLWFSKYKNGPDYQRTIEIPGGQLTLPQVVNQRIEGQQTIFQQTPEVILFPLAA